MRLHSLLSRIACHPSVTAQYILLRFPLLVGMMLATLYLPSLASPRLNAQVSWVGNSYPGATKWVQQDIRAMAVAPDGTIYTNVFWDEGGGQVAALKDGELLSVAYHTHGWGYQGGNAVAVNDKYLYFAQTVDNEGGGLKAITSWPPKGKKWTGIARRLRSDITKAAPFDGGKGGDGDTLARGFLVINEFENGDAGITGLCASNTRVYVSNPFNEEIRVYDAESMALLANWPVPRAGQMALAADGSLWVIQQGNLDQPSSILHLRADNGHLVQSFKVSQGVKPVSLCLNPQGQLLVADQGERQQILVYGKLNTTPVQVGAIGKEHGIYAGTPGKVGPLRFNNLSSIGCDAVGNLYVAQSAGSCGGSTVLECYAKDGTLRWNLFGLEFVDMADLDPINETELYTKEEHFTLDYHQPVGKQWRYTGYTIYPGKYPQDPRMHLAGAGAWVRRIQGQPFLFVTDMNAVNLQVYRFNPKTDGEITIPAGLFCDRHLNRNDQWPSNQPAKGEWIWRDNNGNGAFDAGEFISRTEAGTPRHQGWWVDARGNVWLALEKEGIRCYPFKGLDAHGNPMWDYDSMKVYSHPKEFSTVKRLRYDPATDTMYLGGTTAEHTNQHWKPMGPVICCYDNWSTPTRQLRWTIVAPYVKGSSGHASCEPMGFDIAGDYLFVPYTGASKEVNFTTGHIEVFRLSDGVAVGFLEPDQEVGNIGLQDIRECLRAYKRSNGEYLIFLEEDFKAKILMYRWKPE
ncbi:MAG TPA: hypothetical protein VHV83_12490 [Armatimonadota bacterium]|nr:hypothetical protein [Armatimonadota bacterium]